MVKAENCMNGDPVIKLEPGMKVNLDKKCEGSLNMVISTKGFKNYTVINWNKPNICVLYLT